MCYIQYVSLSRVVLVGWKHCASTVSNLESPDPEAHDARPHPKLQTETHNPHVMTLDGHVITHVSGTVRVVSRKHFVCTFVARWIASRMDPLLHLFVEHTGQDWTLVAWPKGVASSCAYSAASVATSSSVSLKSKILRSSSKCDLLCV